MGFPHGGHTICVAGEAVQSLILQTNKNKYFDRDSILYHGSTGKDKTRPAGIGAVLLNCTP